MEFYDREKVLYDIAMDSIKGRLGLFVGSGFSKGVLQFHSEIPTLDWPQLLQSVCTEFKINYKSHLKPGLSFPDIASSLCLELAKSERPELSINEAQLRFKEVIARNTTWYPSCEQREYFGPILENLYPNWIITTNYDLVLESILVGKAVSVGPDRALPNSRKLIPIYHLHGMKYNPNSLILTREDYVSLFRPNEYRQAKLATAVKENTTLLLGYNLGDINVLTALDWSRNVYSQIEPHHNSDFIQVLYCENPKESPYRNEQGILVIEMGNLATFMDEINLSLEKAKKLHSEKEKQLSSIAEQFNKSPSEIVSRFIDDQKYRETTLALLKQFDTELVSSFLIFFAACIDKTWKRAEPHGAFEPYNQQLLLILDIFDAFEFEKLPPALFELLANSFENLSFHIGRGSGQSWAAHETWIRRKNKLDPAIIRELNDNAKSRWYKRTEKFIEDLI